MIQRFLADAPLLNALANARAVDSAARGHFQLQPSLDALNTVIRRAPVRHDKALEAPIPAQHLIEQPLVL